MKNRNVQFGNSILYGSLNKHGGGITSGVLYDDATPNIIFAPPDPINHYRVEAEVGSTPGAMSFKEFSTPTFGAGVPIKTFKFATDKYVVFKEDEDEVWYSTDMKTGTIRSIPTGSWPELSIAADGKMIITTGYGDDLNISTNDGVSWTPFTLTPPSGTADNLEIVRIDFVNSLWVMLVIDYNASPEDILIYTSSDGSTWTVRHTHSGQSTSATYQYYLDRMCFHDGTYFVFGTFFLEDQSTFDEYSFVYRSSDGITWTAYQTNAANYVPTHGMILNGTRFIVSDDNKDVYYSDNGGATWTYSSSIAGFHKFENYAIGLIGATTYIIATASRSYYGYDTDSLYYSANGGLNWTNIKFENDEFIYKVLYANQVFVCMGYNIKLTSNIASFDDTPLNYVKMSKITYSLDGATFNDVAPQTNNYEELASMRLESPGRFPDYGFDNFLFGGVSDQTVPPTLTGFSANSFIIGSDTASIDNVKSCFILNSFDSSFINSIYPSSKSYSGVICCSGAKFTDTIPSYSLITSSTIATGAEIGGSRILIGGSFISAPNDIGGTSIGIISSVDVYAPNATRLFVGGSQDVNFNSVTAQYYECAVIGSENSTVSQTTGTNDRLVFVGSENGTMFGNGYRNVGMYSTQSSQFLTAGLARSVIIGGSTHEMSGSNSAIIGGGSNVCATNDSIVLGGNYNGAVNAQSIACGQGSRTRATHDIVHGNTGTSSDVANNTARLTGAGQWRTDVAATTPESDYAELMEWGDGNPDDEDRVGFFVKIIEGTDKITIYDGTGDILGIVSANPGFIGNAAPLKWKNIYEKDEWGRKLYEEYKVYEVKGINTQSPDIATKIYVDTQDVKWLHYPQPACKDGVVYNGTLDDENYDIEKHPKLSPSYDPAQEYIPRDERPEWSPIGFLGQIMVRTSAPITGNYVSVDNQGMAVNEIPSVQRYQVLTTEKEYVAGSFGIVKILFR